MPTWNERLNDVFQSEPKPLKYKEIEAKILADTPGLRLDSLRVIICKLVQKGLLNTVKPQGKLTFYYRPDLDMENLLYKYNPLIKSYECTP